MVFLNNYII